MKFILFLILCLLAGVAFGATGSGANDFAAIDRWFADAGHILGKLNEFSGTLLIAVTSIMGVGLELLRRIRKAQKEAAAERQAIAAENRNQNADIVTHVEDVKAKIDAVAPTKEGAP